MAQRIFQHRRLWPGTGLVVWMVLAGAVLAVPARADVPHPKRNEQYKRQVEKMEEAWRAAQLSGDADAMDKLLSDDYVGITMTGQVVTKTQQLDRMRNRSMVVSSITLTDVKVKLIGTTAVVQALADVDGRDDGEPMHGMYRYTRVYTRLPSGTWKITNFEATRVGPPPEGGRHPPPPPDHPQDH
jgi:ketosteroid isomerase-like protein